ncbi:MAG: hypothetical protein WC862_05460 [Patescibacteria group bacterium]
MSKNKLTQFLVILLILAVLGLAGYFGVKEIKKALKNDDSKSVTELSSVTGADVAGGEEQVYTHPDYGFTLRYPAGLKLGKFPEGEGEILLLQAQSGPPDKGGEGGSASSNPPNPLYQGGTKQGIEGFQIFISPYNETEEFSKEVILKADPKMKIENEKWIDIGAVAPSGETATAVADSPLSALVFDSSNDSGSTHEVWFVADGNLYQATSFEQYGGEMERILGSLTFN